MSTFEDLLQPVVKCATCSYIAGLPKGLQDEVDAAMTKTKYGSKTLARGLAQLDPDMHGSPPREGSIQYHRERQHRVSK